MTRSKSFRGLDSDPNKLELGLGQRLAGRTSVSECPIVCHSCACDDMIYASLVTTKFEAAATPIILPHVKSG